MKTGIHAILVASVVAGCSATQPLLSAGNLRDNPGKKVSAQVSNLNVLGLNPLSMEHAQGLFDSLRIQCGGSKLTGVCAFDRNTFLFVATVESMEAFGYCASK
jgi:hypothetical protein